MQVGEILNDRYLIKSTLGSGSSAIVYVAYDQLLEIEIALKVFLNSNFLVEVDKNLLMERLRVAAVISHSMNVHIYDFAEFDKGVYVSMELLQGETLANCIAEREKHLSNNSKRIDINSLVWGLFDYEKYLSKKGIYCYIHPNNIFFQNDGSIKILSLPCSGSDEANSSIFIDNLAFVSEQSLGEKQKKMETLQFTLAAIAYYAFTGKPPPLAEEKIPATLNKRINKGTKSALLRALGYGGRQEFSKTIDFVVSAFGRRPNDSALKYFLFGSPYRATFTTLFALMIFSAVFFNWSTIRLYGLAFVYPQSIHAEIVQNYSEMQVGVEQIEIEYSRLKNERDGFNSNLQNYEPTLTFVENELGDGFKIDAILKVQNIFKSKIKQGSTLSLLQELNKENENLLNIKTWLEKAGFYLATRRTGQKLFNEWSAAKASFSIFELPLDERINSLRSQLNEALIQDDIEGALQVGLLLNDELLFAMLEYRATIDFRNAAVATIEKLGENALKSNLEDGDSALRSGEWEIARDTYIDISNKQ